MLLKIRSYASFFLGFVTLFMMIGSIYVFPFFSKKIRKIWGKFQLLHLRASVNIKGELDQNAQLFIVNHRSVLDIIALEAVIDLDTCWIGKREITDIPFVGHTMKAPKMISIDREDKKGLIGLLRDAKDRLDKGRVIMIFPEGTRSSGRLLKFHPGAQLIGNKYDLTVQPIVIVGAEKILDTKRHRIHSGTVHIEYLPSFKATKESDWLQDSREKMQVAFDRIEAETASV